jgi:hypothetical protein
VILQLAVDAWFLELIVFGMDLESAWWLGVFKQALR